MRRALALALVALTACAAGGGASAPATTVPTVGIVVDHEFIPEHSESYTESYDCSGWELDLDGERVYRSKTCYRTAHRTIPNVWTLQVFVNADDSVRNFPVSEAVYNRCRVTGRYDDDAPMGCAG